jgi:hypothetical protein
VAGIAWQTAYNNLLILSIQAHQEEDLGACPGRCDLLRAQRGGTTGHSASGARVGRELVDIIAARHILSLYSKDPTRSSLRPLLRDFLHAQGVYSVRSPTTKTPYSHIQLPSSMRLQNPKQV